MRALLIAALAAVGIAIASAAAAQDPENTLVIDVAGEANGTVEIALRPDLAPEHVERLKTLAREGAYDNVVFHRVIDGFMAQTGDVEFGTVEALPEGRAGTGGSDMPNLPAEFSDAPFERGTVGMARAADPDSANSQFFVMFAPAPHLDGQYTVVGEVVAGQEVIDAIARGDPAAGGMVDDPDVMTRVRVKSDL